MAALLIKKDRLLVCSIIEILSRTSDSLSIFYNLWYDSQPSLPIRQVRPMTLREQPQSLSRLSPDSRTHAKNEAGRVYAVRLRSTVFVHALILAAIWASTSYPIDHYNVLEGVSSFLALGITLKVLAISARKTIWSQSSNRWYGMIAVATLMTAGSLAFCSRIPSSAMDLVIGIPPWS